MKPGGLVVLAQDSESTRMLVNRLDAEVGVEAVIVEDALPALRFAARRVARLGLIKVVGQILFVAVLVPLLRRDGRSRLHEIRRTGALDTTPLDPARTHRVSSVNSATTIDLLRRSAPGAVVLSGTRIVSPSVLEAVPAPFLNLHAGITPAYRGVHGAYWALAMQDRARCGVTVHHVDAGIDTGEIVEQALISPTRQDSFVTYPIMQLAAGLPLLEQATKDLLAGRDLPRKAARGGSASWSHPTIWGYGRTRLRLKVR